MTKEELHQKIIELDMDIEELFTSIGDIYKNIETDMKRRQGWLDELKALS